LLAWTSSDPKETAARIYKKYGFEGGDDYVIVRADRVDHPAFNMVIPVDAADDDQLALVKETIEAFGVTIVEELKVTLHTPYPPHEANGYIHPEELPVGEDRDEFLHARRLGNSPGFNAWG
jgi:hypothetical protein